MKKLRDAFSYDAETGVITRVSNGKPAFATRHSAGYRHGGFEGSHFLAHRVAWLCAYGEWPQGEIDHINGDRADNRLCNLRQATRQQNIANNAAQSGRKSRYKGVSKAASGNWVAYIVKAGRHKHLGTFKCEAAAAVARAVADTNMYGAYARPNCGVA